MRIVIIGGGAAAVAAADSAIALAKDAEVDIFTAEPHLPYMRPRLSAGITQPLPATDMLIKPLSWYKYRGVNLHIDCRVDAIMPDIKRIRAGDVFLPYDRLIIATGAYPHIPPIAGLTGEAYALREYNGLSAIKERLYSAQCLTIIGGGVLGMELAWEVRSICEVHVLETKPWILHRHLTRSAADVLHNKIFDSGIWILADVNPDDIPQLAQGVTVVTAGVKPNVALARDAGIKVCDEGIIVDNFMSTSMPDIFAAGDCAYCDGIRTGYWGVASGMGSIAGANAAGQERVYHPRQPPALMRVGRLGILSAGDITAPRKMVSNMPGRYVELFLNDDALAGGIIIGDNHMGLRLSAAIGNGVRTAANDVEGVFKQLEGAK